MTIINNELTYDLEQSNALEKTLKMPVLAIIFFWMSFFFSHALIFDAVAPFFLPFWYIVRTNYERFKWVSFAGGILGAATLTLGQATIVMLAVIAVELVARFRYIKFPPMAVIAGCYFMVQVIWQIVFHQGIPPFLVQLYIAYEIFFAVVIYVFMKQFFVPIPQFKLVKWTTERVVAGLILIAVLIIGMESIVISYFSLPIICLHLAICVSTLIGGLSASIVVSVIVGMLVGISQLSFSGMLAVYALTGLVVGMTHKLGRAVMAISSCLPSVFFLLYDATLPLDSVYFISIIMATVLFMFLPKRLVERVSIFYSSSLYVEREPEVDTEYLVSFQRFVHFMKELVSGNFEQNRHAAVYKETDPPPICSGCYRYEHCWGPPASTMRQTIEQWQRGKASGKALQSVRLEEQLKGKCVKPVALLEQLQARLYKEQMQAQLYLGKKMVALQLRDLSFHLQDVLKNYSASSSLPDEQVLRDFLKEHQIDCFQLQWVQTTAGELELLCAVVGNHGQSFQVAQEIIALLSDLLEEPLEVARVTHYDEPFSYDEICINSAIRYQLEYDIYRRTQSKDKLGGDTSSVFDIHEGLTAIMLSDGMGASKRAQQESSRLIGLMKECLSHQMKPETAMHTLHYTLSLRDEKDMYATLDFALVDLQLGQFWCWKSGGMTTYVLRGPEVFTLESKSAPIGSMTSLEIETDSLELVAEDTIVMISDGLFTTLDGWDKQENFFLQMIRQSMSKGMAPKTALYEVMNQYEQRYQIEDDCTVMLFKVKHRNTNWATVQPSMQ